MTVRTLFDRVIHVGTWIALVVSLATGLAVALAQSSPGEAGIAWALVFMLVLFGVSAPLHLALAVASAVRGLQGAWRPMWWVYAYLVVTLAVHAAVGARMGAFEGLEQELAGWQREREQPAQVALERALMQPVDLSGVRAALAQGADPDGSRPQVPLRHLFAAAMLGQADVVGALLDGGADPNLRSTLDGGFGDASLAGPSPLDAAAFSDSPQRLATVRRLLEGGADPVASFARLGACRRGDLALWELAVAAGAPDLADRKGNGCLHFAAMGGHADLIERALAAGADVNAANEAGRLPLDTALAGRKFRAALALAKAGGRATLPSRIQAVLDSGSGEPDLAALRDWLKANAAR